MPTQLKGVKGKAVPVPLPEKKCPKCPLSTSNPAEMTRHIRAVHDLASPKGIKGSRGRHPCPHCPAVANTRIVAQLSLGILPHANNESQMFTVRAADVCCLLLRRHEAATALHVACLDCPN